MTVKEAEQQLNLVQVTLIRATSPDGLLLTQADLGEALQACEAVRRYVRQSSQRPNREGE